ncbi:CDP-glycerol glycerophosphotransferase family protein [Lentilactobacillus laojiaonis]|uniref:CDP-glycerol glycerophosphotransferase family protein n=1 Tax=Lentilactobacillus laojiaonis TaxID=2883998 RepID=UPI001D0A1D4C|nr:CDP-glycerol glycerophosphotransferase family protein [Lentilactobacillus laojiaonis]UDM31631.1 CDP-glycerol glycerophosphotransferase family protein [Lentilactobacillus laojiaonis]
MKDIYIKLIHFISILNLWKKRKNIFYLMSFDSNVGFIKKMAQKLPKGTELVVLYKPETEAAATDLAAFGITTKLVRSNLKFALNMVPKLMSAKIIFCDNYFAFLAGLAHPSNMKIVQVWHADGAIKKFGWEDPKTSLRSKSDQKRFQMVYDQFDEYIVASKAMGNVFINSYRTSEEKMQLLGYPRSDKFFKKKWIDKAKHRIFRAAPELKNRRVILYAPTYRKDVFNLPSGIDDALSADPNSIVVVKLHPSLRGKENNIREQGNPRIKFYHQLSTSDLLTVADTLVTDYSSVAFDFSLLKNARSIIFFMFDLENYEKETGIQSDYMNWLPSKPVKTVEELRKAILNPEAMDFTEFNDHWNTYNDGHAASRVIKRYL